MNSPDLEASSPPAMPCRGRSGWRLSSKAGSRPTSEPFPSPASLWREEGLAFPSAGAPGGKPPPRSVDRGEPRLPGCRRRRRGGEWVSEGDEGPETRVRRKQRRKKERQREKERERSEGGRGRRSGRRRRRRPKDRPEQPRSSVETKERRGRERAAGRERGEPGNEEAKPLEGGENPVSGFAGRIRIRTRNPLSLKIEMG